MICNFKPDSTSDCTYPGLGGGKYHFLGGWWGEVALISWENMSKIIDFFQC